LFLIIIFLIGNVSAQVSYKESLTIYNYKIKQVQCSNNSLRVLIESNADANLNLMFKITSKTVNSIFSNQELKRFETNWFLITTNKACNELKKLEVNGYLTLNNQNIVYLNSESSYLFTGLESPITQTTTTSTIEILPSTQEALTATTTSISTSNIYFGSKLIETINSNNEVKYYHQDYLGSTRVVTNANGVLVNRFDYQPFGSDSIYSSSLNNKKFTGKQQDSSNLYYYGARYYDPKIGRFTSVDPSFNPSESSYVYVSNNPLNKIDPDGRQAAQAVYQTAFNAQQVIGNIMSNIPPSPLKLVFIFAAISVAALTIQGGYAPTYIDTKLLITPAYAPADLTKTILSTPIDQINLPTVMNKGYVISSLEDKPVPLTGENFGMVVSAGMAGFLANTKTGNLYFFPQQLTHAEVASNLIQKGADVNDLVGGLFSVQELGHHHVFAGSSSFERSILKTTTGSSEQEYFKALNAALLAKKYLTETGVSADAETFDIGVQGARGNFLIRDLIRNNRVIERAGKEVNLPLPSKQ